MNLSDLKPAKGAKKNKKRLGRGQGTGRGGTSTRGHKGAKSRSGYTKRRGFEGGQMPLQRRVPKFGFKNRNRIEYKAINIGTLQALYEKTNVTVVTKKVLMDYGLITKKDRVKILGKGKLTAKLKVKANAFSKTAKKAIEAIEGKAMTI